MLFKGINSFTDSANIWPNELYIIKNDSAKNLISVINKQTDNCKKSEFLF